MAHDHIEAVPNPDYAGPTQHCLPPEVVDSPARGVIFVILMILLVLGAATMGAAIMLA